MHPAPVWQGPGMIRGHPGSGTETCSAPWDVGMPIPPLPHRRCLICMAPVAIDTTAAALGYPAIAVLSVASELLVANTIILTAVFGSDVLSERAFRLLRWATGASEPQGPKHTKRA
jgi:hypothetical protein